VENKNILKDKSFQFAIRIVKLYLYLKDKKSEYILGKQMMRSGTSVGSNIRESQNAESKMDFIHKLSIAQKECDETLYWLELLQATGFLSKKEFDSIYLEGNEILRIIRSVILTTKRNLNKGK
jgi:four helix bundle protein